MSAILLFVFCILFVCFSIPPLLNFQGYIHMQTSLELLYISGEFSLYSVATISSLNNVFCFSLFYLLVILLS